MSHPTSVTIQSGSTRVVSVNMSATRNSVPEIGVSLSIKACIVFLSNIVIIMKFCYFSLLFINS